MHLQIHLDHRSEYALCSWEYIKITGLNMQLQIDKEYRTEYAVVHIRSQN